MRPASLASLVAVIFAVLSVGASPAIAAPSTYIKALSYDDRLDSQQIGAASGVMCRTMETSLNADDALCYQVVETMLMLTATQLNLGGDSAAAANVRNRMANAEYILTGHVRQGKHGMILDVHVSIPIDTTGELYAGDEKLLRFRRKGIKDYAELEARIRSFSKRAAAYIAKPNVTSTPPPAPVR